MADSNNVKGKADVIFLLDVTDSMDYCIEAVKKNIEIFVNELQEKKVDWRARIIGFRNCDVDGDDWWDGDKSPFTSDVNELKKQLAEKHASGGSPDYFEESVLDALYMVANMEVSTKLPPSTLAWRPTGHAAKCVILFTDYGCQNYVSCVDGNLTQDEVVKALQLSRIRLRIIAPTFECYENLGENQGIIYEDCGPHEDFAERIRNADYFASIIRDFARTVTASATVEMN